MKIMPLENTQNLLNHVSVSISCSKLRNINSFFNTFYCLKMNTFSHKMKHAKLRYTLGFGSYSDSYGEGGYSADSAAKGWGASSGGYGGASGGYGGASGGYGGASGTASAGWGSSGGYGAASGGYGAASGGYGAASGGYGAASGGYGGASGSYGDASGGYGAASGGGGYGTSFFNKSECFVFILLGFKENK